MTTQNTSLKLLFVIAFSFCYKLQAQVIPLVQELKHAKGTLNTRSKFIVSSNSSTLDFEKSYLENYLKHFKNDSLNAPSRVFVNPEISVPIRLILNPKFKSKSIEAYRLEILSNQVKIEAKDASGVFRGITTFIQMYAHSQQGNRKIPASRIHDYPKFSWRGMHLDVCRHFFGVEFIKKYIDLLALYKMNVFHWHLTDDQGWRIEIKKYPELTRVGSWRSGTMVGPYSKQQYDSIRYGGFYTQEEIKEIVAYAAQRHITVVPEIEMPGHAMAALAAYPQFSCTGGPFEVAQGWGVFIDVFCAKEETFNFLEDVLSEVLELFPSKFIHIGGDECPKVRWKSCPKCQKTMQVNNIKDEHELQSYFIRRMEKFLSSKGRKLIGWDEILEGGLAPGAAVMSWRGTEGGLAAAKMKHEVVMTPGSHCYFDHYQGDPRQEPLAFGGFTSLEKVYGFNPIPKDLSKKEAAYILGAQGNVWTEYISGTVRLTGENFSKDLNFWKDDMTPEQHVEYMVLPRLLALAEVTWGTANPEQYPDFLSRVVQHKKNILAPLKYNFSRAIYDIKLHVYAKDGVLYAELSSPLVENLYYGIESRLGHAASWGFSSSNYKAPVAISHNCTLSYHHDFDGLYASSSTMPYNMRKMRYEQAFYINKATAKTITLAHPPHGNYSFGGAFTLVNGIQAPNSELTKDWLGFSGKDLIATIDLHKSTEIKTVGMNVLERIGSWVYYPKSIHFEVSENGVDFKEVAQMNQEQIEAVQGKVRLTLTEIVNAKFIRVRAVNHGLIEAGNPGAGHQAWLFADEILVD